MEENKLPIDLKTKWIAALRSGEYEQGKSSLEDEGKFCCLGVLCNILEVPTRYFEEDEEYPLEWIPKNDKIPAFLIDQTEVAELLANKNDGNKSKGIEPLSFDKIADFIDKNL